MLIGRVFFDAGGDRLAAVPPSPARRLTRRRLDFPQARANLCSVMNDAPYQPARWTVTALTRYVRQMFETDYRLLDLEIEREVSNLRTPASGHAYFTLKDAASQLRCVMWRSDVGSLRGGLPRDGDRVIARGSLTVYEAQGEYQLKCRTLRAAGLGDLYARFEELKKRLEAEGLFAPERKRPIPARPRIIGLATSPSTAALQDVLNVLSRRYPLARLVLAPTLVQGEQAPAQIVAALAALNRLPDCDVILVVRGGGSIEDLWCFNDEAVARAIAASRIPVISGVGHEIDFTLADFAADLRAPTPSAAAEIVSQITVDDLRDEALHLETRLLEAFSDALDERRRRAEMAVLALSRLSPRRAIDDHRQRVDDVMARAERALQSRLALQTARLAGVDKALSAINPLATLARGYAIVRRADGQVVRRAADAAPGDPVDIRLHDGTLKARIERSS